MRGTTIDLVVMLLFTMSCAQISNLTTPTRVSGSSAGTIGDTQRTWYGAKARVAVMEFDNKTGVQAQVSRSMHGVTIGNPIGAGMKEQLVTALMQTGKFIVEERQGIRDVVGEQDFGASGRVKRETTPAIGRIEGAEFLIYGAVTEYTPSQASITAGGGVDPIFGIMAAGSGQSFLVILAQRVVAGLFANQDHVAIDLRLVDAGSCRRSARTVEI